MPKQRIRIAIVLNRFYPEVGGAETNLHFQVRELAKCHDVSVFTPWRLKETAQYEELEGFKVYRLRDWKNISGAYPNIRRDTFILGVFFRILFGHFDIVQVFPALNHNNILALLAAKIRRIPYILCSFDLLDYAELQKRTGTIDPGMLKSYVPGKIRQWLFGKCSHIFAISNREIEVFRRYNKSVSFSPVPINPEEYLHETPDVRAKYGIDKKAFVFLSLGRIARIKGQDLAAEAFVQCAKDMPDAKLVFVGRSDYDPAMLKEMKEKLAQAGLTPRCVFTGMVPRDEVIGFLQQSSIHVIPVRFMNSGAVVVESWAGGIPVIQSDAVDPNLVEVGKNGYLFHSEKVAELAECMKKAYVEREKLGGYAQNGRKKVLQEFTYQHLIKLYNEVYEKLLV